MTERSVLPERAGIAGESAKHYLQPGFLHVGEATTITTILGSCVAVCVWDPASRIGGMNHFLLSGVN